MRCFIPFLFLGCSAQAASEGGGKATSDAGAAPAKRVIEVSANQILTDDGVRPRSGSCYVEDASGGDDMNECCPKGWHVLAFSPDGLLCEDD